MKRLNTIVELTLEQLVIFTTLCLTILFSLKTQAQYHYSFSHSNQTYQSISNPTYIVTDSTIITDYSLLVQQSIPNSSQLPKTAFGERITGLIYGGRNGFITAYGDSSDFTFDAFLTELVSNGQSEFRLKDTLINSDSLFMIEWYKFGIKDHPIVDFLTFKISFNLSKEIVEFSYGASNLTAGFPFSGQIVLLKASKGFATIKEIMFMTGNYANPTFTSNSSTLNSFPPNGTVFRFTGPSVVGIKEESIKKHRTRIFPNPTSGSIKVEVLNDQNEQLFYNVRDIAGKSVLNGNFYSASFIREEINLNLLADGFYTFQVEFSDTVENIKFIKQ